MPYGMAIFQSPKNIFQRPKFPGKCQKFRRKSDFAKFQAPKFENSEPEKMPFHTPSHSIAPLDSLLQILAYFDFKMQSCKRLRLQYEDEIVDRDCFFPRSPSLTAERQGLGLAVSIENATSIQECHFQTSMVPPCPRYQLWPFSFAQANHPKVPVRDPGMNFPRNSLERPCWHFYFLQ